MPARPGPESALYGCDCCGEIVSRDDIARVVAYGTETCACGRCRGEPEASSGASSLHVHDNQVRRGSEVLGTFSGHWPAVAAMIRASDPAFKSLGGDAAEDLAEERRMHARLECDHAP